MAPNNEKSLTVQLVLSLVIGASAFFLFCVCLVQLHRLSTPCLGLSVFSAFFVYH